MLGDVFIRLPFLYFLNGLYLITHFLQDMLISLKKLVIQRSKVTGYENLADKFDVKMLRALGMFYLWTCLFYLLLKHQITGKR